MELYLRVFQTPYQRFKCLNRFGNKMDITLFATKNFSGDKIVSCVLSLLLLRSNPANLYMISYLIIAYNRLLICLLLWLLAKAVILMLKITYKIKKTLLASRYSPILGESSCSIFIRHLSNLNFTVMNM